MYKLFFAIYPPEEIIAQIDELIHKISWPIKAQLTKLSKLHLTVVFIGKVDSQHQLNKILEIADEYQNYPDKIQPFSVQLDKIEYFQRNQLSWLGVNQVPQQFISLEKYLNQQLINQQIITEDLRAFKPHVTMSRKVTEAPTLPLNVIPITFTVDHFTLVNSIDTSDGNKYVKLNSWNL